MAPKFSKNGKRLGRPPKNPALLTAQPEGEGTVFVIAAPVVETPVVPVVIDLATMIECEFLPITQHVLFSDPTAEKKAGIYSGSSHRRTPLDRYVVLAYLKTDYAKYRAEGLKNEEIVQRCVNFLNATEPRAKFAKKDPTPKFGRLELFKEELKFVVKDDTEVCILVFTTDSRKCEFFFGEGSTKY